MHGGNKLKTPSILYCTVVPLGEDSGGTIVCREHVQRLSRLEGYDLHVMAPSWSAPAVEPLAATFHPIEITSNKPDSPEQFAGGSRWPFSFERNAHHNKYFDFRLKEVVRETKADIIIIDYLFTALFFPSAFFCDIPVIVVTLNREREFYADLRRLGRLSPGDSDTRIAEWRLGLFEDEVYAKSDAIVVLSQSDLPMVEGKNNRPTVIEPVLEESAERWDWTGVKNVFYVGNVAHYPNYAAVRWLCTEFAPELAIAAPDASITIIGASEDDIPGEWHHRNVELLGRSTREEVVRQFGGCGLFIAPIENNFGSKIKVLEALSRGTPTIATSEALTGLTETAAIPRIRLDDPQGAARLAADLLASPEKVKELSVNLSQGYRNEIRIHETAWASLIQETLLRPAKRREVRPWSFLKPTQYRSWPNQLEIACNDQFTGFTSGLFPLEGVGDRPLRWIAPVAEFHPYWVGPLRSMSVKIWGIVPEGGIEFRILVNGMEVYSGFVGGKGFARDIDLPPGLNDAGKLVIRIESAGFKTPGDERLLGLALESIILRRYRPEDSKRKLAAKRVLSLARKFGLLRG